jgi:diadenosine tetraphosphatase ApaH/serine/threonine PP2A family protein phosphatase
MTDTIPDPVASYLVVLDELLAARARGPVDDDDEERFVVALNDWRGEMTPEQEAELEPLIAERLKPA